MITKVEILRDHYLNEISKIYNEDESHILNSSQNKYAELRYLIAYFLNKYHKLNHKTISKVLNISRSTITIGIKKIVNYIEIYKEYDYIIKNIPVFSKNIEYVYIAGKVTGLSEYEAQIQFTKAEELIKNRRQIPINPTKLVSHDELWITAMRKTVGNMLLYADRVYFLKNWRKSRGAKIEHLLCIIFKIPFEYE